MGAGWQLSEPATEESGERGAAWAREARAPLGAGFHAASHAPCASRPRGPPPPRSPLLEGQAGVGRKTRASGPVQTPAARPAGRRGGAGTPLAGAWTEVSLPPRLATHGPHSAPSRSAAPISQRHPAASGLARGRRGEGEGGGNGRKGSRGVHAPAPARPTILG